MRFKLDEFTIIPISLLALAIGVTVSACDQPDEDSDRPLAVDVLDEDTPDKPVADRAEPTADEERSEGERNRRDDDDDDWDHHDDHRDDHHDDDWDHRHDDHHRGWDWDDDDHHRRNRHGGWGWDHHRRNRHWD
jgi:hypothetical protein